MNTEEWNLALYILNAVKQEIIDIKIKENQDIIDDYKVAMIKLDTTENEMQKTSRNSQIF